VSRRDALILRAAALWTVFIWGTRIRNILGDDTRSAGFKAVHTVLALVSVAFAVGLWAVASRNRKRSGDRVETHS
jgi:small neutral amino acid transporter SnatA (MarC family)